MNTDSSSFEEQRGANSAEEATHTSTCELSTPPPLPEQAQAALLHVLGTVPTWGVMDVEKTDVDTSQVALLKYWIHKCFAMESVMCSSFQTRVLSTRSEQDRNLAVLVFGAFRFRLAAKPDSKA